MDVQEISHQLKQDSSLLSTNKNTIVMDLLYRINAISQTTVKDTGRQAQLIEAIMRFHEYTCEHPDWTSALPTFNFLPEDMEGLCLAAQFIENATETPLADNLYFLVGMRQLLTVFNFSNVLERALASQYLEGWTHCFEASILTFFDAFLEHIHTNKIPCRLPSLPDDLSAKDCLDLFRLEMNRARHVYAKGSSEQSNEYNIFQGEVFETFLQENFDGSDPDPRGVVGQVLCRRLLLYIEWYIS